MEQKKSSEKDYQKRSPQYFLIGLVVALSTTLLAFEYRSFEPVVISNLEPIDYTTEPPEEIVITYVKPTPPPPPPLPAPPVPSPDPEPTPVSPPEPIIPEPKPTPKLVNPFMGSEVEKPVVEDIPVNFAEIMPEFEGGLPALYAYLGKNMKFPPLALDNKLEAKLHVQFIVNKDGTISNVELLNPAGYGFDEEAIRVIKAMPKWKPGRQAGRNVSVYFVLPINFTLLD
jgi:protein TonB